MAIYAIKDLEKLSGIKAHTIRIWEKRYNVLKPQRTDTNIRFYTDDDLRMLLNIAFLVRRNYKISKISKMSASQIEKEVHEISSLAQETDMQLDALTISMIEMDASKFENILQINIDDMGFERAMLDVIYPFLDKLTLLWMSGSIKPVQESYITQLIKKKLYVAIENDDFPPQKPGMKAMIFLPEGENQELSLLFVQYLLMKRGVVVHNLGNNINYTDAIHGNELLKPSLVFTIFNELSNNDCALDFVNKLAGQLRECPLYITGYYAFTQIIEPPKNVFVAPGLTQIFEMIGVAPIVTSETVIG